MKTVIQKIIVAGIIISGGKVLIIQRSSDEEVFPNIWEIPSGKREFFEKSQDAIVREVKEETGIDIEVLIPVGVFEFKVEKENETRDSTQISFLCKPIGSVEVKLSEEHQNFAWVKENEIGKYNLSDDIKKIVTETFNLVNKGN